MNKHFFIYLSALAISAHCLLAQDIALYLATQRANRKTTTQQARVQTSKNQAVQPLFAQPTNGDEELYADKRGSYGKGLAQLDSNGLVNPAAFQKMVNVIRSGVPLAFNTIPMGTDPVIKKLVSPESSYDINLIGGDSWRFSMQAPPTLTSAEKADEMVELYWQSIARDVLFSDYNTNSTIADAIADLNNLSDFQGPTVNGAVTPTTVFRMDLPGVLAGPYISQFLYLDVSFSDTVFSQRYTLARPNDPNTNFYNDFLTNLTEYLSVQAGNLPIRAITPDPINHYIASGRDLASFVHNDPPQLPYIFALLILLGKANQDKTVLNPGNPYLHNKTQSAFVDFNTAQYISLIGEAAEYALRAAWYQKWNVHRTLRPEEFGYLVHQQKTDVYNYGLNDDVINSPVLPLITALNQAINTDLTPVYLLSQTYPEGCPLHPTYPAGHAAVAGACVTMLKAFFNNDYILTGNVVPDPLDSTELLPYTGGDTLTVGGELNKLGANIAMGRDFAGVHFRSDCYEGLLLGEQVALSILEDWAYTMHIPFSGFTLTTFSGKTITVGAQKEAPRII